MMYKSVGVTLDTHTDLLPGREVIEIVKRHEALGFESQWLSDAMGREPFALAATLLAHTSRIKVGTAIANIYGRDAMTAAQMRTTLAELSGGRFLLGLGVSNQWINDLRHAEWIAPVPKLRAYLEHMNGDLSVSCKPAEPAPVYVAAHAAGLQRVGREHADGLMTWTMPPQHIQISRQRLGPDKAINAQMVCIFEEDADRARETARKYLQLWLAIPSYRVAWTEAGFDESDFEDGGSDRWVDAIAAWGSPEKIADKIAEYHDAGATRVITEPVRLAPEVMIHPLGTQVYVLPDFEKLETLAPILFR